MEKITFISHHTFMGALCRAQVGSIFGLLFRTVVLNPPNAVTF